MPNIFALTLKAQNSYPGNSVIPSATQQVPDLIVREEDLISGVFEVFGVPGTGANTLTPSGTTINSVINGGSAVALTNPITNATLVFTNFRGLYVTVTRRDPAVAPTSTILTPIAATTTSSAIGAGTKTFTVASGLSASLVDGMRVRVVPTGSTTEYMEGTVSYATTVLTVVVDRFAGSASYTAWTVTGVICAQVKSAGYGGIDTGTVPLPIRENGALIYNSAVAVKVANSNVLTSYLNGTNGLNINILTLGS
jgi:hypothetical protein